MCGQLILLMSYLLSNAFVFQFYLCEERRIMCIFNKFVKIEALSRRIKCVMSNQ